jgi:hypothetical protein
VQKIRACIFRQKSTTPKKITRPQMHATSPHWLQEPFFCLPVFVAIIGLG